MFKERVCPDCSKVFYDRQGPRCRTCQKEKNKLAARVYRKINPDKVHDYDLKKKYGINKEDYFKMLKAQKEVCAICRNGPGRRRLCVDHCHSTNKVRGLLCDRCNAVLGSLGDTLEEFNKRTNELKYYLLYNKSNENENPTRLQETPGFPICF